MDLDTIRREVASIRSMIDALKWAQGRRPPAAFIDSVAHDEYTHDVVVRVAEGVYVVFDTT